MTFDRIVVVDWSAGSRPRTGPDSVWIAVVDVEDDGPVRSRNPSTRAAAVEVVLGLVEDGARTLVGVDASLGYPSGTAAALGCTGVPWSDTWELLEEAIDDDAANRNNRFAVAADLNRRIGLGQGPFWGCPPAHATPHLASTKPASFGALGEWRHAERGLRSAGLRPFSVWQLLGAGSVGSQTLLAIHRLAGLRRRRADVDVWPFTTGLRRPDVAPGGAVLAEVWPSMYPHADGAPRDRAQVEATATRLADAERRGELDAWFAPPMRPVQRLAVEQEEGWVLGAAADPLEQEAMRG